jgi:hypothetical protein
MRLRLRSFLLLWQFGVFLALPVFDDLEVAILVVGSIVIGPLIFTTASGSPNVGVESLASAMKLVVS